MTKLQFIYFILLLPLPAGAQIQVTSKVEVLDAFFPNQNSAIVSGYSGWDGNLTMSEIRHPGNSTMFVKLHSVINDIVTKENKNGFRLIAVNQLSNIAAVGYYSCQIALTFDRPVLYLEDEFRELRAELSSKINPERNTFLIQP